MSQVFSSIKLAAEFLREEGWKISKSTLQRHLKKGLIRPDLPNGAFSQKALRKYAGRHLVMQSTLTKISDEDLQREKMEAEVLKLKEQGKLAKIQRMAKEGKYVLRESVDLESAAKAAVFKVILHGIALTRAGDFIQLVNGDEKKVGDLTRELSEAFDMALNEVASSDREYTVVFEANEPPEGQTEEIHED